MQRWSPACPGCKRKAAEREVALLRELADIVRQEHSSLVGLAWVHGWRPDAAMVKRADSLRFELARIQP